MRGGWELDGMPTGFAYLTLLESSNIQCGRVLSGWPDPKRGAFAPELVFMNKENRTTIQNMMQELFRFSGSTKLLEASFFDFRCALFASLLMNFEPLKENYGTSHILTARILEVADLFNISTDLLNLWCDQVRENRIRKNTQWIAESYFRTYRMQGKKFVLPIPESIDMMKTLIQQNHQLLNNFIAFASSMKADNDDLRAHVDELSNEVQQLRHALESKPVPSSSQKQQGKIAQVLSYKAIVQPVMESSTKMTVNEALSGNTLTQRITRSPSLLTNMKGARLCEAFETWFTHSLHVYKLLKETKYNFHIIKYVVEHMKTHLSDDQQQWIRLPVPNVNSTEYSAWKTTLAKMSQETQAKTMENLEKHRDKLTANSSTTRKRKRSWTPVITSTYKRLKKLHQLE